MSAKVINRVTKIVLLTGIILVLSLNSIPLSIATSLDDLQLQKNKYDAQKRELEERLNRTNSVLIDKSNAIDNIMVEIQLLQEEIQDLTLQVAPLERLITEAIGHIESVHNDIIAIENITKERDSVVKERVRAMQVQGGPVSYIDVLLGSNSFTDFIDRFSTVNRLLEADQAIIKQQADDQKQLISLKASLALDLEEHRKNRTELKRIQSILEMKKITKNALIDKLEVEQEKLQGQKKSLQSSYEEVHQMSKEVEDAILAEQQRMFNSEKNRFTSYYCQSNGDMDLQKYHGQFRSAGELTNAGQLILDASERYGIDPVLMAAISLQETGNGGSNAVKIHKNPGGLMDPSSNWSELLVFDSLADGLDAMAKTLQRMINSEGRVSIADIGQAYAPVGAENDPLGVNEYWVPNVTKKVAALGGLTMNCENQFTLSISDGTWATPAQGRISSHFGWRIHPIEDVRKQHRGLDIANVEGSPIVAAGEGIVTKAGLGGGYGKVIMVTHVVNDQVYTTVYAHLSHITVQEGQRVAKGQLIGQMGSTGKSTGSHLHFEFHEGYYSATGTSAVNPLRYVTF